MKRVISACLILCLVLTYPVHALAAEASQDSTDAEIVNIMQDVTTSISNADYDAFISLTAGNLNESLENLFFGPASTQNAKDNIGFWNVESLNLLQYKEIPSADGTIAFVDYGTYSDFSDLVTYYVSMDLDAKEDNREMFTGTNFFIFIFGRDNNNEYKLLQWSEANIDEMQRKGIAFDDGSEEQQTIIQHARLNGTTLSGEEALLQNFETYASYDPNDCPIPSTIRVMISERQNGVVGEIDTMEFYYYVKNVLPNEWVASTSPYESLKAGAMAVKMYGWFHCYYYKYWGEGFDVYDDTRDQHYVKDSEYPRSTDAINAVGGVGIVNSDGSMFETQYNRDSTGRGSGMIGQNYAGDLAEYSGYDWFDICDYFYSNSVFYHSSNSCVFHHMSIATFN